MVPNPNSHRASNVPLAIHMGDSYVPRLPKFVSQFIVRATLYEGVGSVKRHFGCTSREGSFFSSPERIFSLSFSCCISPKARFLNPAVETGSPNHLFGHLTSNQHSFSGRRDRPGDQGANPPYRVPPLHQV